LGILDGVDKYERRTEKERVIKIVRENQDKNRMDILAQVKMNDSHKVREGISQLVVKIHEQEAFYDQEEIEKAIALLKWAIYEAEWSPVKEDVKKDYITILQEMQSAYGVQ
jgi:hypothetical protein